MNFDYSNVTHVVIQTGNAPFLTDLPEIESSLREDTGSQMTCIFTNSTVDTRLGVLVSSPTDFDFRPDYTDPCYTGDLETYHTQVSDLCHQLLSRKSENPFYSDAVHYLDEHLTRAHEQWGLNQIPSLPCTFTYERIIDAAFEWSLKPVETADFDEQMSYQDRLAETQQVITALGGLHSVEGTICFKMDPDRSVDPFQLINSITAEPIRYCVVGEMTRFRCVHTETMDILIITYGAKDR